MRLMAEVSNAAMMPLCMHARWFRLPQHRRDRARGSRHRQGRITAQIDRVQQCAMDVRSLATTVVTVLIPAWFATLVGVGDTAHLSVPRLQQQRSAS